MKSIKPGRGPLFQSAIASFAVCLFGIFWTKAAINMGASMMAPFGLIFIFIAIANGLYALKNATSKNRNSIVDIVDSDEEKDPLNVKYKDETNYCPHCGAKIDKDYTYCPKCGKKIV